jgi:hypothetical protein
MERTEIYSVLDGERAYQETRWNCNTTSTCGKHSVTEFLVFIQDYVNEALHTMSRNPDPYATETCLHSLRKITALGVACMEQHGVPRREGY